MIHLNITRTLQLKYRDKYDYPPRQWNISENSIGSDVSNLHFQTADDLEPLLEIMDSKAGISTQTLVSTDGQQQKAAKLPQYVAAVSGNVETSMILKLLDSEFSVLNGTKLAIHKCYLHIYIFSFRGCILVCNIQISIYVKIGQHTFIIVM